MGFFNSRHLINIHHEKIDARLCEHCGQRSNNRMELYYHIQTKHNILPPQGVTFPECKTCHFVALDASALDMHHLDEGHGAYAPTLTRSKATKVVVKSEPKVVKEETTTEFACDLCDKSFMTRKALTMHRNVKHRTRTAKSHGDTDEEDTESEQDDDADVDFDSALRDDVDYVPKKLGSGKKVQVLSNVPVKGKTRSSEADSLSTVATGIATSLGLGEEEHAADTSAGMEFEETVNTEDEEIVDDAQMIEDALASVHGVKHDEEEEVETKFLAEDGSELQLTAAQKAELMSQLTTEEKGSDEVVMVYEQGGEAAQPAEALNESAEVIKDGDEVLMVYGGPRSGSGKTPKEKPEAAPVDEEEEVEKIIAEVEKEVTQDTSSIEEEKVEKEKNKLIKELEGDWEDDEVVDEKAGGDAVKVAATEEVKEDVKPAAEEVKQDDEVEPVSEVKEEIVSPQMEAAADAATEKKAAPEAALAEFMDDWGDDE